MRSVVGSACVVSSLKLGWVGECFVFPSFHLKSLSSVFLYMAFLQKWVSYNTKSFI